MGFFGGIKDRLVAHRLDEEELYALALKEVEEGNRRPGLWAKALSEAAGQQEKAQAIYLKLLVARLRDEGHVLERLEQKLRQERMREARNQSPEVNQEYSAIKKKAKEPPRRSAVGEFFWTLIWAAVGAVILIFVLSMLSQ